MGAFDWLYDRFVRAIADRIVGEINDNAAATARKYRVGAQPKQLRVAPGQYDDNLTQNLCGVIIDRAVSQLVGHGVKFDFEGETETEQEKWIGSCLDANRWEILLSRAASQAAEAGTGYLTILPDAMVGEDGQVYPRVVLLAPEFMSIQTHPDDWEIVTGYTMQYKTKGVDGKEVAKKREYRLDPETEKWIITDYESRAYYTPKWEPVASQIWPYEFAPVLHWQNLPSVDSQYGRPEIGPDGYEIQDRLNAVSSNISKIIRLYAHPVRVLINASVSGEKLDVGPDKILQITTSGQSPNDGLQQLPAIGDLSASMQFGSTLRRTLFDISRTVDVDSLGDKLGQLTNFGLRVLYQDNMSKIETKRRLFEDMLEELVRRLLIISGRQPVPCEVVWPEILPVNEAERAQFDQVKLDMGLVSRQTLATGYGIDWEQEQERIQQEKQGEDNIGAALLRAFDRGQA